MSSHEYIMVSLALKKIMEHILENQEPDIDHIHSLAYRALKNYGPKLPQENLEGRA